MPAASAARAITPSRASISRTRWPLPRPPIAGLHDISPIVAKRWVTSAVAAPERAAAVAASQPAWPPPMTTTSNLMVGVHLFHVKHNDVSLMGQPEERKICSSDVMAGLVPAIHVFDVSTCRAPRIISVVLAPLPPAEPVSESLTGDAWMAGTSPAMT